MITWPHASTKWFERPKKSYDYRKRKCRKKNPGVLWEYGLVHSTIQNIWKNRTKMISAFEQSGSRIKRFRKPQRRDVDERLKQQRNDSDLLNCPLVMTDSDLPIPIF